MSISRNIGVLVLLVVGTVWSLLITRKDIRPSLDTRSRVNAAAWVSDNTVLAVGQDLGTDASLYGWICRSVDKGDTWSMMVSELGLFRQVIACRSITTTINGVLRNIDLCVAGMVLRTVQLSIDGGLTWTLTSVPLTGAQKTFTGLAISTNGTIYMVAQNVFTTGSSLTITDNVPSFQWTTVVVQTIYSVWTDVSAFAFNQVILVGSYGLKYKNGGDFLLSDFAKATCVCHVNALVAIACNGTRIDRTNNGGRTWTQLATFSFSVMDAFAVNSTMYYVVGSAGAVGYLSTTVNMGETWTTTITTDTASRPNTISATNGTGVVVTAAITTRIENDEVAIVIHSGQTS